MSKGPENTFIGAIHKLLPPALYRMKNNNPYNSGIADCWYSDVEDLWIEYKFIVLPKRADTLIDLKAGKQPALSRLQQDWLRERSAEGRNVWVIVGHKNGGVIFEDDAWKHAWTCAEYRNATLTRQQIAEYITHFCAGTL